eukprot:6174852-Pleurochrysis_carterae.AAC.4
MARRSIIQKTGKLALHRDVSDHIDASRRLEEQVDAKASEKRAFPPQGERGREELPSLQLLHDLDALRGARHWGNADTRQRAGSANEVQRRRLRYRDRCTLME